ncbi:MAG: glycosyltransferase family 2 protein [Muribaculaceae bacterium]|nr:glycosyltransferase family 2 protein [Muribaculaceae bacterium]
MAKISIIIPIYNVEDYLRQALDSVVNQTLEDIELICIDDCSTDSSWEILKEYAEKDSRIRVHRQAENRGQGVARNIALKMATGKYIMFLDPDDWFDIRACEIAYNQIEKNNNDVVFFNYSMYKETDTVIIIKKSQHLADFESYSDSSFRLSNANDFAFKAATVWCQIYNREYLLRVGALFSETRTCEDNPFYFNAICNAETVSVIPQVLYYFRARVGEGQPDYVKHWKDVLFNKNLAYEIVKNSPNKDFFLKAYLPYYWNSLWFGHLRRAIWYDKSFRNDIYRELHLLAQKLNKEYPMSKLKDRFDYNEFKVFLCTDKVLGRKLIRFLFKIFSIAENKTHVILRLFGIKFVFKRR